MVHEEIQRINSFRNTVRLWACGTWVWVNSFKDAKLPQGSLSNLHAYLVAFTFVVLHRHVPFLSVLSHLFVNNKYCFNREAIQNMFRCTNHCNLCISIIVFTWNIFLKICHNMLKLCKFTILWRWHKMNHSWFTKHRCNHLFNDIYFICRHSGSVVERPLCDREDAGSIPGRVISKNLKMVLAALLLCAQHWEYRARTGQLSVSIMWLGGISCQSVWGVIFQWGNTLQVSIELPAISRHRRDMTERLLKVTLSPNQTNIY